MAVASRRKLELAAIKPNHNPTMSPRAEKAIFLFIKVIFEGLPAREPSLEFFFSRQQPHPQDRLVQCCSLRLLELVELSVGSQSKSHQPGPKSRGQPIF